MIANDWHKLEKFKQKSSFRIAMAVFVLITILLNLPSSVNCNNNNKSVEDTEEILETAEAAALMITTTTTESTENIGEYNNKNMNLHRIQTPEGPEHRSLEVEHRSLELKHRSPIEQDERPLFTPRVEYNSWQPVGRGDPLKNDPTYDYSPPVVEPVRYWAENTKNENPANSLTNSKETAINKDKNEILILGVPAKRQNYRKESKYISHEQPAESFKQQYVQENQNHQTTKLQGTIRRSYSYGHYHNLPTRLMPPPMQTIAPPSTITSVNKLMPTTETYYHTYHHHYSSMPPTLMTYTANTNNGEHKTNGNTVSYFQHSSSSPVSNSPNWIFNKPSFDTRNAESISYVSITKPEANGIPSAPQSASSINVKQPYFKRKPWIHELLSKEITKSPPLVEGVNYVSLQPSKIPSLPPPQPPKPPQPQPQSYIHQPINTLRPVQVNVTNGFTPIVTTQTPIKSTTLLLVSSTSPKSSTTSTTSESMTPKSSPSFIHSTYPSKTTGTRLMTTTAITAKSTTLRPMPPMPTQYITSIKPQKITTPKNKLTTDVLFSHYKQPERPLFGPLYLIIEGHSKVKTYGLKDNDTKTMHEPKIVPIQVPDREVVVKKHVVLKDENGQAIEVKHLHNKKSENKEQDKDKTLQNNHIENESEPLSLLSFLDSSLGSLFGRNDNIISSQNNLSTTTTSTTPSTTSTTTTTEKLETNKKSSMIFVTTVAPHSNDITSVTKTTVLEPIGSALIQESKETRQVFDYDQYDKPSIFDFFNTGEEYNDYEEIVRENDQNLNEHEISNSSSLEESNEKNIELNTSEMRYDHKKSLEEMMRNY